MKKTPKKTAPKNALPKKKTVAAASASRKKETAKPAVKKTLKTAAVKGTKSAAKKSAAKKPVRKFVKKTVKKTVKKANTAISAQKKSAEKKAAKTKPTEKNLTKISTAGTAGKVSVKPNLKKNTGKQSIIKKSIVRSTAKNPAKLNKPVKAVQVKTGLKTASKVTPLKKAVVQKISAVKPQTENPKIHINTFLQPEKPENGLFSGQVQENTEQEKIVKDVYSAEELKVFEQKLRQLRSQLRGDFDIMTGSALSQNRAESGELSSAPTHPADVGTDNFEQEQTFAFIQSRSERLEDIDEALERTKDGTYGVCERCCCKIPKARLNYLPYVTMCVKCTEITEREAE